MKKDIILTPPESLVRHPNTTILSIYSLLFALLFTAGPSIWCLILSIPAAVIIIIIDDREEQRKGFHLACEQLFEQLSE